MAVGARIADRQDGMRWIDVSLGDFMPEALHI